MIGTIFLTTIQSGVRALNRSRFTKVCISILSAAFLAQLMGGSFFVLKMVSDLRVASLPIIPWHLVEVLEILATLGITSGAVTSLILIHLSLSRAKRIETQLAAAATGVQKLVEGLFSEWGLTEAERDVALLVVKGFSNAEISSYRGTTESTTKSQVSSVFRKSGLKNRQQLVSIVVEDVFTEVQV